MSRSEIEKAAEMEKSKAVRTLNSLIEKKILKKQVQAGESDTSWNSRKQYKDKILLEYMV